MTIQKINLNIPCWKALPEAKEGHIGRYTEKVNILKNIVSCYKPKVIAQTGLNAGHSAVIFLEFSNAILYSFDLGKWNYVEETDNVLNKFYKKRHKYIKGDSRDTLEKFNKKIDFAFVDGGHKYDICISDIKNFDRILNKNGIILIDDLASVEVKKATEDFDWSSYKEIKIENFGSSYPNGAILYQKQ